MSKGKNIFFVGKSLLSNEIKNVKFTRCPREMCYCDYLISRPEKTKITELLIINANKCRKEFYQMQRLAKSFSDEPFEKRFG